MCLLADGAANRRRHELRIALQMPRMSRRVFAAAVFASASGRLSASGFSPSEYQRPRRIRSPAHHRQGRNADSRKHDTDKEQPPETEDVLHQTIERRHANVSHSTTSTPAKAVLNRTYSATIPCRIVIRARLATPTRQ